MQQRFYMMCLRETVGTNASFHRKDGHGYSSDINAAHVYTLSEAQSAWETGRSIDLPVSADCVDALTVWHVDHQLIPHATVEEEGCDQYVAFLKGVWDGNDVYWLAGTERPTTDFSKAYIHPFPVTSSEGVVWLPYHQVAAVKRRTFNISLLDRRKMIQVPGLRMPKWLKLQNRRRKNSSGKVRWNCPSCGRISWQLNPYDFDGCSNVDCRGLDGQR